MRFLFISSSFPLYFRLRWFAELKRKYSGNERASSERLTATIPSITLYLF
jgi:hypothetical protein